MAQELSVIVGAEDRARLAALVDNRVLPLKHVHRARITLASAERLAVAEVARRAGVTSVLPEVRARFVEPGQTLRPPASSARFCPIGPIHPSIPNTTPPVIPDQNKL